MQAVGNFLTLCSTQVVPFILKSLKTFFSQKVVRHFIFPTIRILHLWSEMQRGGVAIISRKTGIIYHGLTGNTSRELPLVNGVAINGCLPALPSKRGWISGRFRGYL